MDRKHDQGSHYVSTDQEPANATEVSQLLFLLDHAFAGDNWHSLLSNLRSTTPDDWDWLPTNGQRSIRSIIQHVGGCKYMYENHAFGDGSLQWDHPLVTGEQDVADLTSAVAWLTRGHARLRDSIAELTDADLDQPRMTNWGEPKATRWIIAIMIEHDIYHAGEINHLRSIHDGDDSWEYDRVP
jgi:uncharacterized damage-inducible protein DinB